MAYAIKDVMSKTYYQKMTGIGPMFGGTIEEAVVFEDQREVLEHTRNWSIFILWDTVKCSDKRLEKQNWRGLYERT